MNFRQEIVRQIREAIGSRIGHRVSGRSVISRDVQSAISRMVEGRDPILPSPKVTIVEPDEEETVVREVMEDPVSEFTFQIEWPLSQSLDYVVLTVNMSDVQFECDSTEQISVDAPSE